MSTDLAVHDIYWWEIARYTLTITTKTEIIIRTVRCISHFTCRPNRVIDQDVKVLGISPLMFSCGKETVGTSQPRKSHSGCHPCFTLYTNNLSGEIMVLTRWLCIRYRFLKTYVDLALQEPRIALRWQSTMQFIFLLVGDNKDTVCDFTASAVSRWFTKLFNQESSSRSLRITLQSGKASSISSQKKFPEISTTASAFR